MKHIKDFVKRHSKKFCSVALVTAFLVCSLFSFPLTVSAASESVVVSVPPASIMLMGSSGYGSIWADQNSLGEWHLTSEYDTEYWPFMYWYPSVSPSVDIEVNSLSLNFDFTISQEFNYDVAGDYATALESAFFGEGNFSVYVNSVAYSPYDVVYSFEPGSSSGLGYSVDGTMDVHFETPIYVSAGDELIFHCELSGHIIKFVNVYDTIIIMDRNDSYCTINYDVVGRQDPTLTPDEQQSIDNANNSQEAWGNSGNVIQNGVNDLSNSMPDSFDAFANAPDHLVYAQGSNLFITLFNGFHVTQVIGPFISFALIMALVVFIMRR